MSAAGFLLFLKMMTWRVLIDVLLIAVVLFFINRMLLRQGAWKILIGLLIVMLGFMAASILDLKGIEWIYSNVSHVAVIALFIIFQPELRKMFERAASLRRRVDKWEGGFSRILADGLLKLARERRGAIVVLPGIEPVNRLCSGGYDMNAKPSFPLFMSIFDPNSPGHDGALIIEDGKFYRFGVRLPLSRTGALPEEYGTRHHAAMGIAEQSDALSFVVSEERGTVSIFKKGKYRRADDPETIVESIASHWEETTSYPLDLENGKGRGKVIFQMVAALALAVFFYSTVIVGQSEILEKVITVPVEYTATSESLALVGDKANEVRLHLVGPKSSLDAVTPDQFSVKIDLSNAVEGEQMFFITNENIRLPKDVDLLDASPQSIRLSLAAIVQRKLTIKPQLVGKLPVGLKITELKITPETVNALLPVDHGKSVTITTTPIYLESIHENTRLFCKIVSPPTAQSVDKRWPDVEVVIEVKADQ